MKKIFFIPILLIAISCTTKNSKDIIGKPIKIGNLLVAQNDFAEKMDWADARDECFKLGVGWRVPRWNELSILYQNKEKIGGFVNYGYLSLDRYDDFHFWGINFYNGKDFIVKEYEKFNVRAVRTF